MKNLKENKDKLIKFLHHEITDINDKPEYTTKELEEMSPRELVDAYLAWNGIIGYTNNFLDFIEVTHMIKLDKIGKTLYNDDIEELTTDRQEILEILYNDMFDANIDPTFPPHPDYLEDFNDFDDFYKAPASLLVEMYFDWEGFNSDKIKIIKVIKDAYMIDDLEKTEELHPAETKIKQKNTSNTKMKI